MSIEQYHWVLKLRRVRRDYFVLSLLTAFIMKLAIQIRDPMKYVLSLMKLRLSYAKFEESTG
jgi:hypothetical protein